MLLMVFNPTYLPPVGANNSASHLASVVPVSASLSVRAAGTRGLHLLIEYECKHGFAEGGSVTTADRPSEVSLWKKNAWKRASIVTINRRDRIGSEFWCWWKNAQPSWRELSDGDLPLDSHHRSCTGDWQELDICGPNGIISFVVALRFWGVVDAGASRSLAVEDVGWALCCMMQCMDNM